MTKATKVVLSAAAAGLALFIAVTLFLAFEVAGFLQGRACFKKGYAAVQRHEYAAAVTDLDAALSKPIGRYWRTYALANRAYCYQQQRRREEAIRDYSAALRLNRELSFALAQRGILYDNAGQRDLALADYTEALRADPNLAETWYRRGLSYMRQRDYEKARSDFREAIRSYPDYEAAYVEEGYVSKYLNDWDGALSSFEVAINLNPKDARAHGGRAGIYRQKKEYDKAVSDLTEAIRLAPGNNSFLVYRALTYDDKEKYSDEIADLTEVIRLDPRNEKALRRRGVAYRYTKDFPRAVADFTELIRITQAGGAYNERARTFFKSGQYAQALADYKQAAACPGGTVTSWSKPLPWMLATCPDRKFRNGPEAVAQATKNCERTEWHNSSELDTLAAAYAETANFDEAVRYELQAIALKDDDDLEWQNAMRKRLAMYQNRQPYREELNK